MNATQQISQSNADARSTEPLQRTVHIRPLVEADLPQADRIFRLAFGTFLGLPDPLAFAGDADIVGTRWRAAPSATLGAFRNGRLVGSNFAARWGSFGFFGPLTIDPALWGQGIAQQLLVETMALFDAWGVRQAGLFTFPQSAMHLALYQKFGFWPGQLTPVMAKSVASAPGVGTLELYSEADSIVRARHLEACRALTDQIFTGLDVTSEIDAVHRQNLGDTVLVRRDGELTAFAICHAGTGSEAGSDTAFIKFGAVRPGDDAEADFIRLIHTCEAYAHARSLRQLVAGVNAARRHAYTILIEHKFKAILQGVAMQKPDSPGFNRADCFVIDDWR